MADFYPYSALPGMSTDSVTVERWPLWYGATWYLLKGVQIDSAAVDATNTPVTELRPGLLMGIVTATGRATHYQPNAVDGSQCVAGILYQSRKMIDTDGIAVTRIGQLIVTGPARSAMLLLLDEQARAQMAGRFIFDDRLCYTGSDFFQTIPKTANYTVVSGTDSGTHFTTRGAGGAVTFTLPAVALAKGNRFLFTNEVDQNMTIAAPAGTLVTFNNAAATSVSVSTAGQKIGATFEVIGNDNSSKWIAIPHIQGHTVTVA